MINIYRRSFVRTQGKNWRCRYCSLQNVLTNVLVIVHLRMNLVNSCNPRSDRDAGRDFGNYQLHHPIPGVFRVLALLLVLFMFFSLHPASLADRTMMPTEW